MTASDARTGAVVVGAGGGQRLGGVEKAFLPVAGKPLIAHSVDVFDASADVHEMCLVVAPGSVERTWDLVRSAGWQKVVSVVPGGAARQDSVRAGIDALHGCTFAAVHDAARPLVTAEIVERGLAAARRWGAAIAAIPVRDTLKRAGRTSGAEEAELPIDVTVDRTGLWAAQTPQVFRIDLLRRAYDALGAEAARFTDDASLLEAVGQPVRLFAGSALNLKLTYPDDQPLIELLLTARREGRL
jgi:2-C-methyl-D-erythritol 4-phosphate cytidylyltransferase